MIVQCYFCGTYNSIDGNLSEEILRAIFDGWMKFVQNQQEMPVCRQCAVSPERRQSYLRQRGNNPPKSPISDKPLFTEPPSFVFAPYIPEVPHEQQRAPETD